MVPVEGFNPDRIRSLKMGMETTLGGKILSAAVLDKDYRSDGERAAIVEQCKSFCNFVAIHQCKEIENFLLVPAAIDRAAIRKVADRVIRTGKPITYASDAVKVLKVFADTKKSFVTAQYLASRRRFERINAPTVHEATINEAALDEFEKCWSGLESRLAVIPGKEALSALNQHLQGEYGITVTPTAIVDAMRVEEIPVEMSSLLANIATFAASGVS